MSRCGVGVPKGLKGNKMYYKFQVFKLGLTRVLDQDSNIRSCIP